MRTFALVAFVAAGAIACSSSETPPTSGGARFQLQGADPTATGGTSTPCPDTGPSFTLATVGDDGNFKLITDGANGAQVSCRIDATHYEIKLTTKNGSLVVSGTYAGTESTDAKVLIVTPTNTYKTTASETCNVHFQKAASGEGVVDADGKIFANFDCAAIKHTTLENYCAVNASGGSAAFFKFSNCQGF